MWKATSAFVAAAVLWWSAAGAQEMVPQAPCAAPAIPAAAADEALPAVALARRSTAGAAAWQPPSCTGWSAAGFRTLLGVSGGFGFAGTAEDLAARFGAVSRLRTIRFWSVSDGEWRPLVEAATALDGPANRPRPDFSPAEMRSGRDLYFQEEGGRTGKVLYRIRLTELSPERLVLTTENVSPIKLALLTLFPPGALQTSYFLDRVAPDQWRYYSLTRIAPGASSFVDGRDASLVNRAVAVYRHIAGLPTDRDRPVALKR